MNIGSYVYGFRKAAESNGVDPAILFPFVKRAFGLGDVRSWLSGVKNEAVKAWNGVSDDYKPFIGGLLGAGGGAGVGALAGGLLGFGAGKGALLGLGLGGLGGALYGSNKAIGGYVSRARDNEESLKRKNSANMSSMKRKMKRNEDKFRSEVAKTRQDNMASLQRLKEMAAKSKGFKNEDERRKFMSELDAERERYRVRLGELADEKVRNSAGGENS